MKHTGPIRTCLGCGRREKKGRLLRLTVTSQGRLIPADSQGRGGYLHARRECVNAFVNARTKSCRSLRVVCSREARVSYAALIEPSLPG
jgi:predicted RNA-binding protein YlxR (DUF448 family)